MADNGGRMAKKEYGRTPSVPQEGKRAKRHDLERRDVPYLHGSDLQQGDVQQLRAGQSALKQQQQPASGGTPSGSSAPPATGGGSSGGGDAMPSYIDLMAGRQSNTEYRMRDEFHVQDFLPMANQIMTGGRASGLLHRLFIRQLRNVQQHQQTPTTFDMRAADRAIEESF